MHSFGMPVNYSSTGKIEEARDRFRNLKNLAMNPSNKRKIRGIISTPQGQQKAFTGRVDRLEYDYGFIVRDGTGDRIFFHSSSCGSGLFEELEPNNRVSFHLGFNFLGSTAIDVNLE